MPGPTPAAPAWNDATTAVHGRRGDNPYAAVAEPLVATATYYFRDSQELRTFRTAPEALAPAPGVARQEYGRYGNPTVQAAEARLAALEGAEDALLTASGMAAVTLTLLALLRQGDHLIITDDAYRRTRQWAQEWLPRWGVAVSVVPLNDFAALERAITPRTRVLFSETPTNPFLRVLDLPRWVELARAYGLTTVLDTTFATPLHLRPLAWGVDYVVHSATKYLAGHHDLLAGAVLGRRDALEPLRALQGTLGTIAAPQVAHQLLRGLKTLPLRVRQQTATAARVARFLEGHPAVERVWYPGLPSHPDHGVARRVLRDFGGVVTFTLRGDLEAALTFVDALRIPLMAPSLGGVETLVSPVALMSFDAYTPEERAALGIRDSLIRLAVGIEDADDLLADLEQALARVAARVRVGARQPLVSA